MYIPVYRPALMCSPCLCTSASAAIQPSLYFHFFYKSFIIYTCSFHDYNLISKALKCWCLGSGRSLVYMDSSMYYHNGCMYSMHASSNSSQCSQAVGLCTQVYVHRKLSNTMSTCTIGACARVSTQQASSVPGQGSQGSLSIMWYRWTFQS